MFNTRLWVTTLSLLVLAAGPARAQGSEATSSSASETDPSQPSPDEKSGAAGGQQNPASEAPAPTTEPADAEAPPKEASKESPADAHGASESPDSAEPTAESEKAEAARQDAAGGLDAPESEAAKASASENTGAAEPTSDNASHAERPSSGAQPDAAANSSESPAAAAAEALAGEQNGEEEGDEDEEDDEEGHELYRIRSRVELGFLDVLHHRIQFGQNGTLVDYHSEGGQDVLFPFVRASVEARLFDRHHIIFLYQPIDFRTRVTTQRDWQIDDLTFPQGTNVNTRYSFPFYRVSYMWDALESDDIELGIGASLQLRNATIVFTSADGTLRRYERDVGPVPILKVRYRQSLPHDTFFEAEADGFYAPIRYLNLGDTDVLGVIADVSVRYGFVLEDTEVFLNARYLGGAADGTSDESEFGDGYTKNWLHTATVSVGVTYDLHDL